MLILGATTTRGSTVTWGYYSSTMTIGGAYNLSIESGLDWITANCGLINAYCFKVSYSSKYLTSAYIFFIFASFEIPINDVVSSA